MSSSEGCWLTQFRKWIFNQHFNPRCVSIKPAWSTQTLRCKSCELRGWGWEGQRSNALPNSDKNMTWRNLCSRVTARARSRFTSSLVSLESTSRSYNSNACMRTGGKTVWLEVLHMHGIAAFYTSIYKKPTCMQFQISWSQLRLCEWMTSHSPGTAL